MRSLLDWLVARYPTAKKTSLKQMVESGRVTINGVQARKLKQQIGEGDRVKVGDRAAREEPSTVDQRLQIVFEDADVLAVDKPAGLLTSTVEGEKRPTLLAIVQSYAAHSDPAARIGLIHRLDRDAAGLLVFSKNNAAYESLKSQFFHHTVERVYTAVVEGQAKPAARIESRLVEHADGSVHGTESARKGQEAVTQYQLLRQKGAMALLRVTLHTGRKHQIRAHLSEDELPIVGDPVYGPRARMNAKARSRLMLFATILGFDHPRTAKRMRFELPLPREMKALIA